jgi:hypothetical protein
VVDLHAPTFAVLIPQREDLLVASCGCARTQSPVRTSAKARRRQTTNHGLTRQSIDAPCYLPGPVGTSHRRCHACLKFVYPVHEAGGCEERGSGRGRSHARASLWPPLKLLRASVIAFKWRPRPLVPGSMLQPLISSAFFSEPVALSCSHLSMPKQPLEIIALHEFAIRLRIKDVRFDD